MAERCARSRLAGKRAPVMPLKRMLSENRSFDPKAIAILLEAYDEVVAQLGLEEIGDKERAAKFIIWIALGQTDLGGDMLRDDVIASMLSETTAVRRLSPGIQSSTG
jgi:hypothetical protein